MAEFVNNIRQHDARWQGTCDAFEFFEYLCDQLERLNGSESLLLVKLRV